MNRAELEKLAAQGEGLKLEFKQKLPEMGKLSREVVALANTEGGILLLGVDDDGRLTGLTDPEEGLELFRFEIETHTRPEVPWTVEMVALDRNRAVLVFTIPRSPYRPHRVHFPRETEPEGTFIRVQDQSVKASRELNEILKAGKRPVPGLKVELGAKEQALFRWLEAHGSIRLRELMTAAGIDRQVASRTLIHLTRAGLLRIRPQAQEDVYERLPEGADPGPFLRPF